MKNIKKYALLFLLVIAGVFLTLFVYTRFFEKPRIITVKESQPIQYTAYQGVKEICLISPLQLRVP